MSFRPDPTTAAPAPTGQQLLFTPGPRLGWVFRDRREIALAYSEPRPNPQAIQAQTVARAGLVSPRGALPDPRLDQPTGHRGVERLPHRPLYRCGQLAEWPGIPPTSRGGMQVRSVAKVSVRLRVAAGNPIISAERSRASPFSDRLSRRRPTRCPANSASSISDSFPGREAKMRLTDRCG